MNNFFEKIFKSNSLTQEVGFDLGTSKISVYLKNKGIVLNEPSVVAVNNKTDQIVAIGKEASAMIGKTPQHITATKPLVNGVISDFEIAEKMIGFILQKIKEDGKGGKF
jgi:rod shape-determining protein MreB and related proteins